MNYQHNPRSRYMADLWRCDSCRSEVDTQSHVLHCPAYNSLREDKDMNNFDHLVKYYSEVMSIRSKMGLKK